MKLLKNNKKADTQLRGLSFLFSIFGIAFMLIIFYVWVGKEVTEQSKTQAEIMLGQTELRIFYSDLVLTKGTDLANKNTNEVEKIITDYTNDYATIDQGSASTSCTQNGIDKDCTLTINLHPALSTVWQASSFAILGATPAAYLLAPAGMILGPVAGALSGAYLMFKAIGLDIVKDTTQTTHLPNSNAQATTFTLRMKVVIA